MRPGRVRRRDRIGAPGCYRSGLPLLGNMCCHCCRPGAGGPTVLALPVGINNVRSEATGTRFVRNADMGRGGAKLGKLIKGVGVLNQADRDRLAAAQAAGVGVDGVDADLAQDAADASWQLHQCREQMLGALRAMAAGGSDDEVRQIDVKWRDILRRSRQCTLGRETADARALHDRARVVGDLRTGDLVGDADALKEMGDRAAQRHNVQIAALLSDAFATTLVAMSSTHEADVARLTGEHDAERGRIGSNFAEARAQLAEALAHVQASRVDHDDDAMAKLEMEREQIRGANLEAINELRVVLDRVVEDLEQRFDAAHAAYVQTTEERARDFHDLRERDVVLSAEIDRKLARVDGAARDITRWRKKAAANVVSAARRNDALRLEHRSLQRQFFALKAAMAQSRQRHSARTMAMALRGREMCRQVDLRLRQAERILRLAELIGAKAPLMPASDDVWPSTTTTGAGDTILAQLGRARLEQHRARQQRDWLQKGWVAAMTTAPRATERRRCWWHRKRLAQGRPTIVRGRRQRDAGHDGPEQSARRRQRQARSDPADAAGHVAGRPRRRRRRPSRPAIRSADVRAVLRARSR